MKNISLTALNNLHNKALREFEYATGEDKIRVAGQLDILEELIDTIVVGVDLYGDDE